jgi:hypothetical protein
VASKIDKLDYINKTIPLIVESFNELKIKQVITIEGEKFILSYNDNDINSSYFFTVKLLKSNKDYEMCLGENFFLLNDKFLSKAFTYTEILKSVVEKLLTEKANKISELKFKLL